MGRVLLTFINGGQNNISQTIPIIQTDFRLTMTKWITKIDEYTRQTILQTTMNTVKITTDTHMTHIHLLTDMTGLVITLTPTIPTNITIINITRRSVMENHLLDIMRVEIPNFLLVELLELV